MSKFGNIALSLLGAVVCMAMAAPAGASTLDLSLDITTLYPSALGASKGIYHGTVTTASYDSTPAGRFAITGMSIWLPNSFYSTIEFLGPAGNFYNFSGSTTTAMVANDKSGSAVQIVPIVNDTSSFANNVNSIKAGIPTPTASNGVSWTLLFNASSTDASEPSFVLSRAVWAGGTPLSEVYATGTYSLAEIATPEPGSASLLGALLLVGLVVGFRRRKKLAA